MANWRESILKHFKPRVARLTLVADPDGLLTEEVMLSEIRNRGYDLLPFADSIAFRFAYESQYRSLWDAGNKTDLVVVLRSSEQNLKALPFDLLKAGRQITFALHQLFPKLNYPVIAGLDRACLDDVDREYQKHDGGQLTERETKEFVLMHCFGVAPKLIKAPVDLLRVLLSLHCGRVRLPITLAEYLVESLAREAVLPPWPLREIVPDRERFLRFLQGEWGGFLSSLTAGAKVGAIPFSHPDVWAYIDTFFLDGSLTPVEVESVAGIPERLRVGVVHDPRADALRRYRGLRQKFETEIPSAEVSHREWQQRAQRWGELVVLRWECDASLDGGERAVWDALQADVESAFGRWMLSRYGSLHNLPSTQQPVMVHHVPRFIAAERTRRKKKKVALLVLDGLAFDQWLLLRRSLEGSDKAWRFQESTAFAWVPTLTSVSRQSIFAGEPPLYFPDSLDTTSKERTHWQRFWEDRGVSRTDVDLVTNLDGPGDPTLEAALSNTRLSVLGIVWNKVDDIMHGMQMQTAGMHDQVRLWAKQGHLQQLLSRLHKEGFLVYLTADHGNVTATGVGNPKEGVLAEKKGHRARVYDRLEFRDEVGAKFPKAIRWPSHGLPPSRHVLLAEDLKAFTGEGDQVVVHGGIALEEVLVPFVAIERDAP